MAVRVVQAGDTLWAIARQNGVTLDELTRANPQIRDPNLIYPGQTVQIPAQAEPAPTAPPGDVFEPAPPRARRLLPVRGSSDDSGPAYQVRTGDTMSGIAQRTGVSLTDLIAANPQVRNPNLIFAGQRLHLPAGARAPAPSAPVTPTRPAAPGANPYEAEFVRAARTAGVPESWATNPALIQLVKHESSFSPQAKNPNSSAFGLFQFLDSTWKSNLPEVPYGTKDPYWQAVGGFRYIQQRYGTPERAWAFWQSTVNRDASIAPADLRNLSQYWIDRNYGGY